MDSNKLKAIEATLSVVEKSYGKGAVMKLGDKPIEHIEAISTGALSLDIALGIGGIPRGRIVEIYGPESSGKTTLALHIIAEAQKKGGVAAFIDAEHALDVNYAKNIGVDVDNMYLSQPDYGEQGLDILEKFVQSGAFDIIVVDSVAALTPKAEIEGDMGDSHMGLQARMMSQALRKVTSISSKAGTTIVFLNQLRMKIGIMFGNPETTTGGNALKFYASVRLDIRKIEKISKGDQVIGHVCRVKVIKNKMAPPFKEAEFDMIYPNGIDKISSLIDAAVSQSILTKSGSWFSFKDEKLANGKEAMKDKFSSDEKLISEVIKETRKAAGF
ncbi:recombinase RecA [bacterium]|nr:MAG: recombinase RecA [bacterium]